MRSILYILVGYAVYLNKLFRNCPCVLKNSIIRKLSDVPANTWTKSGPAMERKGTDASLATALASIVFPVPGGPVRRAPLGIFAPRLVNVCGCLK